MKIAELLKGIVIREAPMPTPTNPAIIPPDQATAMMHGIDPQPQSNAISPDQAASMRTYNPYGAGNYHPPGTVGAAGGGTVIPPDHAASMAKYDPYAAGNYKPGAVTQTANIADFSGPPKA